MNIDFWFLPDRSLKIRIVTNFRLCTTFTGGVQAKAK